MDRFHSSTRESGHQHHDEEDLNSSYSKVVSETTPLSHQGNVETSTPRLLPRGFETQHTAAATSTPASTPGLDDVFSNTNRQLESQMDAGLVELQVELQNMNEMMAYVNSQLAATQRAQQATADARLSFESRLPSIQARLTIAEARAESAEHQLGLLEKEEEETVAILVAVKQTLQLLRSGKRRPLSTQFGNHELIQYSRP